MINTVYRYFEDETHAESLVGGKVYLSTLKECRGYENPQRGDKEEGYEHYHNPGMISGLGSDFSVAEQAARLGIRVDPRTKVVISGGLRTSSLYDAYVLCTTVGFANEDLTADFGEYCVEIRDVEKFTNIVGLALSEYVPDTHCAIGEVKYKERSFSGLEPSPGRLGFVKPPDLYSNQKEFRFVYYVPDGWDIAPIILNCPDVIPLVSIVDRKLTS